MRGWAAFSVCALAIACGGRFADPGEQVDASVIIRDDAGTHDATVVDAGPSLGDFHDVADLANWSSFDVSTLNPEANGFFGATFDGRYVYLAPDDNGLTGQTHGHAFRFDTRGVFTSAASWSTFDTTTLNPAARGFGGAAFDGRYVYFIPHGDEVNQSGGIYLVPSGLLVRFDTHGLFTDASAWTTVDLTMLGDQARGYCGATFDGRYLYLVPQGPNLYQEPPGLTNSIAVRYDTTAAFADAASYATIDIAPPPNQPSIRCGAVFDGRYVYFSQNGNGQSTLGVATRYDTHAPFTASSSWTTFDAANLVGHPDGFAPAAFDGRFFYELSYWPGPVNYLKFDGVTVRYDSTADFADASSWEGFDTSELLFTNGELSYAASFFRLGAFDGRFVYFIPDYPIQNDPVIARYDVEGPYSSRDGWSFSPHYSEIGATAQAGGAVFDGQSIYFVPSMEGKVQRFEARSNAAMPKLPAFAGSFF